MALEKVDITNPVSVTEVVELALDQVTDPKVVFAIPFPMPIKLTSSTTPPVTKSWSDNVPLVAGVKTLDLEALVNANLPNVDFVGLKIQILQMTCPLTNTGPITITRGAVNGYDLGGASSSWAVNPGGLLLLMEIDTAPDVAAVDSELDFAGTGTEVFDILMVAG